MINQYHNGGTSKEHDTFKSLLSDYGITADVHISIEALHAGITDAIEIVAHDSKSSKAIQNIIDGLNIRYTRNLDEYGYNLYNRENVTYCYESNHGFVLPWFIVEILIAMLSEETSEPTHNGYIAIIEYTEENKPMAIVINRKNSTRKYSSIACTNHHRLESIIAKCGKPSTMFNDIGCTTKYTL